MFFTAGHPGLNDTRPILRQLAMAGVDLVEIGMPFSDPIADGDIIQQSSQQALDNGMTLDLLFEQLKDIRQDIQIPLILMGYLNPVLQFGMERFVQKAAETGIDGVILPDLPLREYQLHYAGLFDKHNLSNIFLITPQTPEARIFALDDASDAFLYLVSSASTTGQTATMDTGYFERIAAMELRNPQLIGFGIRDRASFERACSFSSGAIIGSAFIQALGDGSEPERRIGDFVRSIRP